MFHLPLEESVAYNFVHPVFERSNLFQADLVLDLNIYLEQFRLNSFRPGQREVVESILSGRDVLCVMPTGGGKSLCYQLPALARGGVNLVISPLIALMKDQVDALSELGIPATFINSSIPADEQRRRIDEMIAGQFRLVYLAPERLRSAGFLRAISQIRVSLLAVDEAHCISQWGHDFRPDYAKLGRFRERLGFPQTVALTATATSGVRTDIGQVLRLNDPAIFVSGFARPNLSLRVETPGSNSAKDDRLVEFVQQTLGSGIIYASTRKNCEHLVELLSPIVKRRLEFYHAGMTHEDRLRVQDNFMSGKTPIVVATNAFGMGIDKRDLRFVVHYNLPGSLEAYYQEAGRAGRDGLPSICLLLYSYQDRFIHEFFIDNTYPSKATVREVYQFLCGFESDPIELTLQDIKDDLQISIGTQGIANCEHLLEKAGAIERLDSLQNMAGIKIDSQLPTLVDLLPRDATTRRKVLREAESLVGSLRGEMVLFNPNYLAGRLDMKWSAVAKSLRQLSELKEIDYVPPFRGRAIHLKDRSLPFEKLEIDWKELAARKEMEIERLNRVVEFATMRGCRQLRILDYFGDPHRQACGTCDHCQQTGKLPGNISSHPIVGDRTTANASRSASPAFDVSADLEPSENAVRYCVQVALSGAARSKARFGKLLIAQMLVGSASKKVHSRGLQKLSTFGLLRRLKQDDVVAVLDWLLATGRLTQAESAKFRPVVSVSATGLEWLRGRFCECLVETFPRELLTTIAKGFQGNTPKMLGDTERDPNATTQSQTSVNSLDATQNGPDNVPPAEEIPIPTVTEISPPAPQRLRVDLPHPTAKQPDYYWTWRLFHDGYCCSQICDIRGLGMQNVLSHLDLAAKNRLPINGELLAQDTSAADLSEHRELRKQIR